MTQQPAPEIAYIIYIEGAEEYKTKKEKRKLPGVLGRLFGAAGGKQPPGRSCAALQDNGAFDHSTIPALLAKVEELKKRQSDCLDSISVLMGTGGPDYVRRETAEIWVGPSSKLDAGGRQAKFHPGDAWRFADDDITAENLREVLIRCDSAESRAAAIAQALTPPENQKLMKPLQFKK